MKLPPRRIQVLALCGVIVLLVGAAVFAFWPRPTPADGHGTMGSGGSDSLGTDNPGIARTTTAPPTTPATTSSLNPSAAPAPSAAVPVAIGVGSLAVISVTHDQGLLGYTFTVTVTNSGAAPASWHAVGVQIGGTNLTVTVIGTLVHDVLHAPLHCLVAAAGSVTVQPGATSTFDVSVTAVAPGLLGDGVERVELDPTACASEG